MRGHGGNVKKTGKRAAALLLSWVMALGGGSMPVMAETVPGRETVREETEGGKAESPESGQTGPQGQETAQPGAAPEESTGGPQIAAPSALLMEASTGTVIFEKNADEPRNPASVTKIMTLILIFDALQSGKIRLDDQVVTSAYAKSMGGSQVFLEEGEMQTVETLIKCIVIASGNDASVAMAEYIGGDEGTFVRMMNERAAGLGMERTRFVDCCGLTDSPDHVTTARDIALMSRELITKYPQIINYSTIWMENITHVTAKGSSEFGLTNTNKLIRQYEYATGLKTGSTSLAKYCVSATAEKDGLELIAVVMAAPDYKVRFADATTLLNYGFGKCRLYTDENTDALPDLPVTKGTETAVGLAYDSPFSYLSVKGEDLSDVKKEQILPETVTAPVRKGDVAGRVVYSAGGRELGSVNIRYTADVHAASYRDYFEMALFYLLT